VFKRLLVPLDRSGFAEDALKPAITIARASHAEIELVMVHRPRPLAGAADVEWHALQIAPKQKYLESIAEEITIGSGVPVKCSVLTGDVVEKLCQRAIDADIDLVVMTSHGRTGFDRAWVGSVADGVLRKSTVPVLIIRPEDSSPKDLTSFEIHESRLFDRILVPLDGSPLAMEALSEATALAMCGNAQLVLLEVIRPIAHFTPEPGVACAYPSPLESGPDTDLLVKDARETLTDLANSLCATGIQRPEVHVLVAQNVAQTIIDFARERQIDAIAMSTHGRGLSRLLIGSVADKVLRAGGPAVLLKQAAHRNRIVETRQKTRAQHEFLTTTVY
jgi:nucleotide-binding universal stress UspA family protein